MKLMLAILIAALTAASLSHAEGNKIVISGNGGTVIIGNGNKVTASGPSEPGKDSGKTETDGNTVVAPCDTTVIINGKKQSLKGCN